MDEDITSNLQLAARRRIAEGAHAEIAAAHSAKISQTQAPFGVENELADVQPGLLPMRCYFIAALLRRVSASLHSHIASVLVATSLITHLKPAAAALAKLGLLVAVPFTSTMRLVASGLARAVAAFPIAFAPTIFLFRYVLGAKPLIRERLDTKKPKSGECKDDGTCNRRHEIAPVAMPAVIPLLSAIFLPSRQQRISSGIASHAVGRAHRMSYADPLHLDVAACHNADQTVVLTGRIYGIGLASICEPQARSIWTDPVDAFVHRVVNLHAGGMQLQSWPDYITDRVRLR